MAAQISAIHNFCQLVLSEIICCFRLRHYFDIKKCHRWSQKKFYNFCFNWNSRCNLLALSLLQYFWLLGICWEANWHCISSAECSISWKNCWLFCWCWCQRLSVLLYPLKFLKLVLLGKFMTKILAAINLAQDHKWSIPLASVLQQGQVTWEVTQKNDIYSCQMRLLGGTPYMCSSLNIWCI